MDHNENEPSIIERLPGEIILEIAELVGLTQALYLRQLNKETQRGFDEYSFLEVKALEKKMREFIGDAWTNSRLFRRDCEGRVVPVVASDWRPSLPLQALGAAHLCYGQDVAQLHINCHTQDENRVLMTDITLITPGGTVFNIQKRHNVKDAVRRFSLLKEHSQVFPYKCGLDGTVFKDDWVILETTGADYIEPELSPTGFPTFQPVLMDKCLSAKSSWQLLSQFL